MKKESLPRKCGGSAVSTVPTEDDSALSPQSSVLNSPQSSAFFTVEDEAVNQRLDVFLAAALGISRARIQRSIAEGDVLVNHKPQNRGSYRVKAGDMVDIDLPEPVPTDIIAEDLPLDILHEDDAIFVLQKPAGMVVHPAAGITHGTLANALAFRLSANRPGTDVLRPGIVHRLDRDTSGLMVVAKTDAALEHLAAQFRERTITKHYTALVYGIVTPGSGKVEVPLERDKNNRLKMAVAKPGEGRNALSLYRVSRYFAEFSLLEVEIKTGRTHQIRVHCAHLKHPIVADEVYGKGRSGNVANPLHRAGIGKLGRQFLHAARLGFTHPTTQERMTFTSPLPADLQEFLSRLET
ncbi:MAG: RluA family pseudouridine synthase [Blastocatellia bacterium]|nr:RluA family pseudouridine synthase [Blastocatellia bacterium]